MILKKFYQQFEPLILVGFILLSLFVAVVIGRGEEIFMTLFQIQWGVAIGVFLFGLGEIANITILGWGTTRREIHIKFLNGLFIIIAIFLLMWVEVFLLLWLKDGVFYLTLPLITQITWNLATLLVASQLGLLFGNLRLPHIIPLVFLAIMILLLAWAQSKMILLGSGLMLIIGLLLTIVNYRLVRFKRIVRKI
jgi:hypothetical protein